MGKDSRSARFDDDEGLGLVELLVSMLILGVVLSATASSLVSSSRQSMVNERRVQATAYLSQTHERLQSMPWELAAHYDSEVEDLATLLGHPDFDVPYELITTEGPSDPQTWRFDGEPLVIIPTPDDGRDPMVPKPVIDAPTAIDGREFAKVATVITWVRDGDPPTDLSTEPVARRFTTIVTWKVLGRTYHQRFESLRSPTAADIDPPQEDAVLEFKAAPGTVRIDTEGLPVEGDYIGVEAQFRRGMTSATVSYPCWSPDALDDNDPNVGRDADEYRTGTREVCTLELDPVDGTSDPAGGHQGFSGDVSLEEGYIWVIGRDQIRLDAEDTALEAVGPRNADVEFVAADGSERPVITAVTIAPTSVNVSPRPGGSGRTLCSTVRVTAVIEGLPSEGAVVNVTGGGLSSSGRNMTVSDVDPQTWELEFEEGTVSPWSGQGAESSIQLIVTAGDTVGGLTSAPESSNILTVNRVGSCP